MDPGDFIGRVADDPVIVTMTQRQAGALARLLATSRNPHPELEALQHQLASATTRADARAAAAASSVFAAAEAVVAGARIDIAAEREAENVANAVATTEDLVVTAALRTAQAASASRDR